MAGIPVVVVAAGGLPVTPSANGYGQPVSVAANGYGRPVTIADNDMGLPVVFAAGAVGISARIMISARSVREDAVIGTVVATLSMVNMPANWGTTTFAETADPDNKFTVTGTQVKTSALLDRETKAGHSITVTATPSGPHAPVVRTFGIVVLDVLEDLSMSNPPAEIVTDTIGVIGAIVGKSVGSTMGFKPGSDFSGNATITGSGEALSVSIDATDVVPGTYSLMLRETLAGAPNSPRDSNIIFSVLPA